MNDATINLVTAAKTGDLVRRALRRCGASDAVADVMASVLVRAEDGLYRALLDDGIDLYLIGDAAAPRLAPYAIRDGRKVGLGI